MPEIFDNNPNANVELNKYFPQSFSFIESLNNLIEYVKTLPVEPTAEILNKIEALENEFTIVKKASEDATADVSELTEKYVSLLQQVTTLAVNVSGFNNKTESIEAELQGIQENITNIKNRNTEQDNSIVTINENITQFDTDIADMQQNISANTSNINTMQNTVNTLSSRILYQSWGKTFTFTCNKNSGALNLICVFGNAVAIYLARSSGGEASVKLVASSASEEVSFSVSGLNVTFNSSNNFIIGVFSFS